MIDVVVADQVAIVTFAELSRLSRYDVSFANEARDVLFDVIDDDEAKVVVLRSADPDFCAPLADPAGALGPALAGLRAVPAWAETFAGPRSLNQMITFAKKVIITEVQGACAGAGVGLVLASDLTAAGSDATFHPPFADHPEANYVLAALSMRTHRARAWALGHTLSAREAEGAGLVNTVVDPTELGECVREMARQAAMMPLDGITLTKMMRQAVLDNQGVGQEFDAAPLLALSHPASHDQTGVGSEVQ